MGSGKAVAPGDLASTQVGEVHRAGGWRVAADTNFALAAEAVAPAHRVHFDSSPGRDLEQGLPVVDGEFLAKRQKGDGNLVFGTLEGNLLPGIVPALFSRNRGVKALSGHVAASNGLYMVLSVRGPLRLRMHAFPCFGVAAGRRTAFHEGNKPPFQFTVADVSDLQREV